MARSSRIIDGCSLDLGSSPQGQQHSGQFICLQQQTLATRAMRDVLSQVNDTGRRMTRGREQSAEDTIEFRISGRCSSRGRIPRIPTLAGGDKAEDMLQRGSWSSPGGRPVSRLSRRHGRELPGRSSGEDDGVPGS